MVVHGPSNLGKTFAILMIAVALAREGRVVLVLFGEGSRESVRARLRRIAASAGTTMAELGTLSFIFNAPEINTDKLEELVRDPIPVVLVVDPLVAFLEGNENDSAAASAFVGGFDRFVHEGVAVILVHHNRKGYASAAADLRGSSVFRAWADRVVEFRECADGVIEIAETKARDEERAPARHVRLEIGENYARFVDVAAPTAPASKGDGLRERFVALLRAAPAGLSRAAIRKALGVSGSKLKTLVDPCIADGTVVVVPGVEIDARGRKRAVELLRWTDKPASGVHESPTLDGGTSPPGGSPEVHGSDGENETSEKKESR